MLENAIAIAVAAHAGAVTQDKRPYILHPMWVMNKVRHLGEDYMIVGILHDVVEDTAITIQFLREEGFKENILVALTLLDMREGDYMDNIMDIMENTLATQVKLRDIEHNSKITRLKKISDKSQSRMIKYHKAYQILKPFRQ